MIKTFLNSFNKLPESNKSMIYLMWIYSAGKIVSHIFINIYVFSLRKNLYDVLIYNIIYTIFISIGFSGFGIIMGRLQKNIKNMYYFSYITFILAFICIFIFDGFLGVYLFSTIYGLGKGFFWNGVHSQELVNINDKNRDIYSSIISSGDNIIKIIVPLIISFIFYIVGKYFNFNAYNILFLLIPIMYGLSLMFIKNIGDYIPSKIKKADIKAFFDLKKYLFGHLYFMFVGFYQGLLWSILPIIAITILKTEINVGLFEGIVGFLSTFIIIFLATKRKAENRVKIMGILSILLFLNSIIFIFNFNFIGFVIFSLINLILFPLYRISEHVFDLRLMDTIKDKNSDFYPTMIFRDILLGLARIISIAILVLLFNTGLSTLLVLKIGTLLIGIFFILAWINIALYMKFENNRQ